MRFQRCGLDRFCESRVVGRKSCSGLFAGEQPERRPILNPVDPELFFKQSG